MKRHRRCLAIVAIGVFGTLPVAISAQASISIHAARALDGAGQILRDVTVVVENGKIAKIERGIRTRADYELGTMTLLPGLIDGHAHLAWYFNRKGRLHTDDDGGTPAQSMLSIAGNAYATLIAGITTVQSPGSAEDKDLRDWIARGAIPGPRLLTSLEPVEDSSLSTTQLRELVRKRKGEGADFIKIFASRSIRQGGAATMTLEQLQALCGEARSLGLRTLVHAHSAESMHRASAAGCTQIEHGIFATDQVLRELAQNGTYFDPQCGLIFNNYLENRPKYEGIGNYNEVGFTALTKAIPLAEATIKRTLNIPGLKVVWGADAVAGSHGRNVEDLICRVQRGGQPAMEAIVSATSLGAQAIGMADRIGTLKVGLDADIIAVNGDPVQDITALRKVGFVMKSGKVFLYSPGTGMRDR